MPIHRRTAMKVRDGRVLKKHNWRLDPGDYRALPQDEIRLDRRRPPEGSRHLITLAELRRFSELLPDWDEVAVGLDAIVLDSATDLRRLVRTRRRGICAWDHDPWDWWSADMEHEHRPILDLLAVERVPITESAEHAEVVDDLRALGVHVARPLGEVEVRWTEAQARAYQLLHILPHELGHHHDRMSTHSRRNAARGEPFAESYAHRVLERVWPTYPRAFEL